MICLIPLNFSEWLKFEEKKIQTKAIVNVSREYHQIPDVIFHTKRQFFLKI